MARGRLLAACVTVAALGYALYCPVPPGISEPWKVTVTQWTMRIINVVSFMAETFGIRSQLNTSRALTELTFSQVPLDPRVEAVDTTFDGVRVRIYRPKGTWNFTLPGLVYYHGGGWVTLSVRSYEGLASLLAAEADIAVVSVNYRLAPEFPFPVPFEDCLRATLHLMNNGMKYEIDSRQMGIAGDSAGGNLAASVALKLVEMNAIPPIRFQGLFYPALQSFDFRLPAYFNNDKATPDILSSFDMATYWLWYFQGHLRGRESVVNNRHISPKLKTSRFARFVSQDLLPERYRLSTTPITTDQQTDEKLAQSMEKFLLDSSANPLMAESLFNQPPTFMMTAEFDVLRDDGFMYARRLKDAGNYIQHLHCQSGYHGFFLITNSSMESVLARKTVDQFVKFIQMVISTEPGLLDDKYVYTQQ